MEHTPCAQAGTMESNDIFIMVTGTAGGEAGSITLESIVKQQFGDDIIQTITDCMVTFGLENVDIHANDRGALKCTIMARMEAVAARYKELVK